MLKFFKPRIAIPIDTTHKFESTESIRNYLHTAKLFNDIAESNDESQEKERKLNKSMNSTYKSEFKGFGANTHLKAIDKNHNSDSIK